MHSQTEGVKLIGPGLSDAFSHEMTIAMLCDADYCSLPESRDLRSLYWVVPNAAE